MEYSFKALILSNIDILKNYRYPKNYLRFHNKNWNTLKTIRRLIFIEIKILYFKIFKKNYKFLVILILKSYLIYFS